LLDRLRRIAEPAQLFGADPGVIARVEDQHHILSPKLRKPDGASVLVLQREIGCRRANRKRIGKEPGKHPYIFADQSAGRAPSRESAHRP
jgi:hypothetical protein